MATLTAAGINFSDGTTMNGTTLLQVGMVAQLFNFSTSAALPGSTAIPSANLGYATSNSAANVSGLTLGSLAGRSGDVTVPGAAGNIANNFVSTTAVSGTWRMVSGVRIRERDGCANATYAYPCLAVRIA